MHFKLAASFVNQLVQNVVLLVSVGVLFEKKECVLLRVVLIDGDLGCQKSIRAVDQ